MLTYEQDPDVVRWGLQLFDSDPYSNCGYLGTVIQDDCDSDYYHQAEYFKQESYDSDSDSRNVENDEVIAHALQEELSQLAILDEPGSTDEEGIEHLQVSGFSQDWPESDESAAENYGCGKESGQEGADDDEPSCPEEVSYCADEWLYSLGLIDEFALVGEVGKRLNQMVPIPHVPRTNGEIPSVDEATVDHQRLLDRLQCGKWVERRVQGDGNCQFRALSDQFYRTPEHHEFVRQQVVNQLKSYPDTYEGYVPMAYGDYLEKMSKSGEWGDHVTLQAAADSYGVKIFVMTSFKETCYIEILPNVEKSRKVICLSFWAEVHYNSIYPEGDLPTSETKKKKKRWMLQNEYLESVDEFQ
ncbi:hypothetical protein L484_007498 [Morus notabilis]|uniref:ubiquitinyl hydrolase 1 n=1 Tax=Morus notabilis TaxID=981085 RepID=W9SRL4_9ROSA|nr:uncharacterized protein LOC21390896 [Morus notabilis]EXC22889.1 hypothetical protein L484_007498 [Morus notabilis]